MNRQGLWIWLTLLGLLLLLGPGRAAHLLIDVVGGITLTVLLLPLVAAGAAFVGWQVLRSRLRTCPTCGLSTLGGGALCPACGEALDGKGDGIAADEAPIGGSDRSNQQATVDARDVTIDVVARSVESSPDD